MNIEEIDVNYKNQVSLLFQGGGSDYNFTSVACKKSAFDRTPQIIASITKKLTVTDVALTKYLSKNSIQNSGVCSPNFFK